uniref:Phospholipid/glycerol acyltransferase domain-containing protein n=1 Tax=Panagrolaimus sp. PS1159 TaxID=55785 RepID=A0AC35FIH6_9BILA
MSWVDFFDSHPYITIFAILLLQLPVVYQLSEKGRYFIRISLYYLSIGIAGFPSVLTTIPTYFQHRGAIYAYRTFQFFTFWVDIDVEVRGKEKLECDGQCVGMAVCWPDRCVVMMKNSLKWIPGFNIAAILSNTIFVNRFNHEKAQETLKEAAKAMSEKNLKLWVFPEGTRAAKGMLPFKKGAFNIAIRSGIPIIPVVFSSYDPFYSKEKRYFHNNGQIIAQYKIEEAPALADRVRSMMLEVFEKISAEAEEKQRITNESFNEPSSIPPPPAEAQEKAEN